MEEITGSGEAVNSLSGEVDDTAECRLANRAVGVQRGGPDSYQAGRTHRRTDHWIGRPLGDALRNLFHVSASAMTGALVVTSRASPWSRLYCLYRRHWMLLVVLVIGAGLRVLTVLAYQPAILYIDSFGYLDNLHDLRP
ncbi:MAG: hypothetical protein ACRDSH_16005, partial [Pseudonocardiaceae bacterium]